MLARRKLTSAGRLISALTPSKFAFVGAALLFALSSSRASAVAIISDPFPPPTEAAHIADLVNEYLQAAQGTTTAGDWLDASPSGTATNRGQSLLLPSGVVPNGPNLTGPPGPTPPGNPPPGKVTIDYSSTAIFAVVSFNDGAGNSGTLNAATTQFIGAYGNTDGTTTSFYTFCIDLPHTVRNGQTYSVTPRSDVNTAFTNGAEMAYIMQNFGSTDLSSNPDQAAAVQIALWDLSLNNNNPTSFGPDADGTYSSGNEGVFKVSFAKATVPEPWSATLLLGAMLLLGVASLVRLFPLFDGRCRRVSENAASVRCAAHASDLVGVGRSAAGRLAQPHRAFF